MEEADFEIFSVLGAWETNIILLVALLILLLASYMTAAYRAGRYLRRPQVFALTSLMLWFSFMIIALIHSSLQIMIDMRELAFFGYTTLRKATAFMWIITVGCSLAPLASILFMLHMRHPRRADDPRVPAKARRSID